MNPQGLGSTPGLEHAGAQGLLVERPFGQELIPHPPDIGGDVNLETHRHTPRPDAPVVATATPR